MKNEKCWQKVSNFTIRKLKASCLDGTFPSTLDWDVKCLSLCDAEHFYFTRSNEFLDASIREIKFHWVVFTPAGIHSNLLDAISPCNFELNIEMMMFELDLHQLNLLSPNEQRSMIQTEISSWVLQNRNLQSSLPSHINRTDRSSLLCRQTLVIDWYRWIFKYQFWERWGEKFMNDEWNPDTWRAQSSTADEIQNDAGTVLQRWKIAAFSQLLGTLATM